MRPHRLIVWILALGCLAAAAPASAQAVRNPTQVVFTASADHAVVTRYELGFFQTGAPEPVQMSDLGRGTPDAQNTVTTPLPSFPIGTVYTAKVRGYAGTLSGDWSAESNPFFRAPAPPPAPVIR